MDWVPHSRKVAVEYLDRLQRDDRIYIADADSGDVRMVFEDADSKTYVDTAGFHGLDSTLRGCPSRENLTPHPLRFCGSASVTAGAMPMPFRALRSHSRNC